MLGLQAGCAVLQHAPYREERSEDHDSISRARRFQGRGERRQGCRVHAGGRVGAGVLGLPRRHEIGRAGRARRRQIGEVPAVDQGTDARQDRREVLVRHHAEDGMGGRIEAHGVEVLRQRRDRVRVVRHVQHQHRLARHDLEAPGQLDQRQPGTHGLGRDRQDRPQGLQCRQHAGRVDQLVGAPQRRIGQAAVAPAAAAPAPLLLVAGDVEVVAEAPQVGADGPGVVDHALRRHRIAHDGRAAGAQDAGLLEADALPVGTQELHVVEVDAGDDGAVGVDDVDGIEATAETDLQDRDVGPGLGHGVQDGQRGEFEVGQRGGAARPLDGLEVRQQAVAIDRLARQSQPLLEAHQMRRREDRRPVARVGEDGFEHGAGRALAVGAGDGDHRAVEGQAEGLRHRAYALEAHVDRLGMQLLDISEPVGEGFHGAGHCRPPDTPA